MVERSRARASLVALALVGLSACYARPQVQPIWPEARPLATVHVGEARTAQKGDIMIDRTDGSQVLPGYLLNRQITVVGTDRQPVVDSEVWAARFRYAGPCPDGVYIVTSPSFYEERIGIVITEDGSITCDMPVVQLVGGKTGRTWQLDEQLPAERVFDPVPFVSGFEEGAVRWQLVYRGRSGGKVALEYIEYRGYVDDNAKPAFQQTTTYDLAATKSLSFRGTEIKVDRATDRDISYRVVRDDLANARADVRQDDGGYQEDNRVYQRADPNEGPY
jgi:hypothetical protein